MVSGGNGKVDLSIENHVAKIQLVNEENLNCFSLDFTEDLCNSVLEISDRDDVSVIAITAKGRAFSTGADTELLENGDKADIAKNQEMISTTFEWLHNAEIPVISGAQGPTVGGGANLFCYASDLRVGAEDLELWWPEIKYGIAILPRAVDLAHKVGISRALEAMFLGREGSIDASEGKRLGMVNRVAPPEQIEDITHDIAKSIADYDQESGIIPEYMDAIYRLRREASGGSELYALWRMDELQR